MTRTRRTRGVGGLAQQATAIHDPSVPPGSENHVKYQEANGEASRAACPNQHATCCLAAGCLYSKREVKTSKMPVRYRLNVDIDVWNWELVFSVLNIICLDARELVLEFSLNTKRY